MIKNKHWLMVVAALLLSLKLLAQSNFCAEFLLPTLEQLNNSCQAMENNQVCYGNNELEANFSDPTVSFAQPSDIAAVPLLTSLHTSAYDSATGLFGLAVMQVQSSNIPNTIPQQFLTFILMGDVSVENAVSPDEAFVPVEPIEVVTIVAANIRAEPNTSSDIILSVAANSNLMIDAVNAAGDWSRVVGAEGIAWIATAVLVPNEAMSSLPVYTRASRTAMQAFNFEAGIGASNCQDAPNQMIIQAPKGLQTSLTINGAELRIDGTLVLSNPAPNVLRIAVLDGNAIVNQINVPGGFSMDAVLSENGIQPNAWGNFHTLTAPELEFHRQILSVLGDGLLTYVPDVPTVEDIRAMQTAFAPTATPTATATLIPESNIVRGGVNTPQPTRDAAPSPACFTNGSSSFSTNGRSNTWGNARFYSNATCSGAGTVRNNTAIIFGFDSSSAESTCLGIGGNSIADLTAAGWNTGSYLYECRR